MNVDPLRKPAKRKQNRPKREILGGTVTESATEMESHRHNLPQFASNVPYGTARLNVCPAEFWAFFAALFIMDPHKM